MPMHTSKSNKLFLTTFLAYTELNAYNRATTVLSISNHLKTSFYVLRGLGVTKLHTEKNNKKA